MTAKEIFLQFLHGFKQELEGAVEATEENTEDKAEDKTEDKPAEEQAFSFQVGQKVTVVPGKEKDPADKDIVFEIECIEGDEFKLRTSGGELIREYNTAEVELAKEQVMSEEVPAEEAKPTTEEIATAKLAEMQSLIEAQNAKIEELTNKLEAFASKDIVSELKNEIDETIGEFNKLLVILEATPGEKSKVSNNNIVKDEEDRRVNQFAMYLSNSPKKK